MRAEDLVGQTLGHYRIKRQVGYGGMATVFLADDIHLGREVAVKVFWPRPGETQDFLRRFTREARVLAQLDHPNILPVYDYGEQAELAYLVTPYMAGGTLKQTLHQRKVLPPSEAIELLNQVLPALQYAHERNLIHRDIKPANLLFKADGSLILADFGLVKVVEGDGQIDLMTLSQSTQGIAGTPEYMAPEQINGKATVASDIYSLGLVFYEMVTGMRPFTGGGLLSVLMKQVHEQPRPPRELNPYISLQIEAVLLRALDKDPQKRFASAREFQQALTQSGGSQAGLLRPSYPLSNPGLTGSDSATSLGQSTNPGVGRLNSGAPSLPGYIAPLPSGPPQNTVGYSNTSLAVPQPAFVPTQPETQQVQPFVAGGARPFETWTAAPPSLPSPLPRQPPRRKRTPVIVIVFLLFLLLGVVGALFVPPIHSALFGRLPITPTTGTYTPSVYGTQPIQAQTAVTRGGVTPAPGLITQPMPVTQTTCPTSGTARAAVQLPLATGNHPTIVYAVNEGTSANPTAGTVKIYDTVTQKKIELAKNAQTVVTEAQISNDGQWVLFVATIAGQSELRLVRLDGHGQQTLLCAPAGMTIRGTQWSFNQQHVIFDEFPQTGEPTVYLLTVQTGALNVAVSAPTAGLALLPRTWLDSNRVLMVGIVPNSDAPVQNGYVLDIRYVSGDSTLAASQVYTSPTTPACWDFDSSFDGLALYIAQCVPGTPTGSSQIDIQQINARTGTPLLNSTTLCFTTVRVIDSHDAYLLALSSDVAVGGGSGDPLNDGLYLVKTSDASFQRLTSTPAGDYSNLNAFSQYFWSNVSRDGRMYALETTKPAANEYILSYGQLGTGTPQVFADIDNTAMAIIGWTTR